MRICPWCRPFPLALYIIILLSIQSCSNEETKPTIDHNKIAKDYFHEDAQWYIDNIPFFECSDKEMEQVYYYRWKLYKAHIRNVGTDSFIITEFINHVPWDREPYCTINAASMHHIYEGRWLKDDRYMNGYIDYLYQKGGNNRRYSESIADATYGRYLVNADQTFLIKQLDSMKSIYNQWSDHWDSSKDLYYIPAMPDATEYTIASIDASGGKAGFDGGDAFRPTINSYMYANALAIARIAAMKGDDLTYKEFLQKSNDLKKNIETNLWNDSLQHFCDRFKQDNEYVKYWNFIRGRELAGMIPWYFNLPADDPKFNTAWKQVTDTNRLIGAFGLRTNEPSYEYYFKQYVFYEGQRGSQWNGPSWPYQTSQVLTGMANFLTDYKQNVITTTDYLKLLRQFTRQHYLTDGKINLVENYDPNIGGPIVYYYWSNHYLHSSFNNLLISGLCGIRPSASDTLIINPLVDSSITYFYLDDVRYHGHKLSVLYDKNGTKYNSGKGITVFIDEKKIVPGKKDDKFYIVIDKPVKTPTSKQAENFALNIAREKYPSPSASVNSVPDSLYQAIDGRVWYFPEITNRWTTQGSTSKNDWFEIGFGMLKEISSIKLYPFTDNKTFEIPDDITIEYQIKQEWAPVKIKSTGLKLIGNTSNTISFENKVFAEKIRVTFKHNSSQVAISEIECY